MDIIARTATFGDEMRARRNKLQAEAARSNLEKLQALAEQAELGREVRRALAEGRDVGYELSQLDDVELTKQVAIGVAADTLLDAVAAVPTEVAASPPQIKVITEEVAREGIQAARELIATQDMSPEAISAAGQDARDDEQT